MTIALLLGLDPVPARPAGAPVRTVRRLSAPRASLPPLPRISTTDPRILRTQAAREEIYALLTTGAHTRQQLVAATGMEGHVVGDRLSELRDLGRAELERRGRAVVWSAVEDDEQ